MVVRQRGRPIKRTIRTSTWSIPVLTAPVATRTRGSNPRRKMLEVKRRMKANFSCLSMSPLMVTTQTQRSALASSSSTTIPQSTAADLKLTKTQACAVRLPPRSSMRGGRPYCLTPPETWRSMARKRGVYVALACKMTAKNTSRCTRIDSRK